MERKDLADLISASRNLLVNAGLLERKAAITNIETASQAADFWQRPEAQAQMRQLSTLQQQLKKLEKLEALLKDLVAAQELDLENEIDLAAQKLQIAYQELELTQYLNGKYDQAGAILSIHPGQGGTEAMDWAEMLSRMYQRYFERKDWSFELVEQIRGEEAGIKEVSFEVNAPYAYGYLKGEQGTHRLVRQSPFNADKLRQTSFALVEVLPLLDSGSEEIAIKDSDLQWNFSRAGGAGGQHVNKVSSAVELTHIPTGIVVKCRQERSQIQNRERALNILKAKLAKIEEEKYEAELAATKGQHHNASWGTQIRNYVLHPYQLVKDTRTNTESSQTAEILDGDLDQFILSYIRRPRN